MARKDEEAQERARKTLIVTLCKIKDLDPMLGGKWQRGMIRYYSERLAEVLLTDPGDPEPSPWEIEAMGERIRDLLASGDLDEA